MCVPVQLEIGIDGIGLESNKRVPPLLNGYGAPLVCNPEVGWDWPEFWMCQLFLVNLLGLFLEFLRLPLLFFSFEGLSPLRLNQLGEFRILANVPTY